MTFIARVRRQFTRPFSIAIVAIAAMLQIMVGVAAPVGTTSSVIPKAGNSLSIGAPKGTQIGTATGLGSHNVLPVDQAFQLTTLQDGNVLLLRWQMPPGYYLYRQRFGFTAGEAEIDVLLPAGLAREDAHFGVVNVFYDGLDLTVPLPAEAQSVTVKYQGCADAGLCYPPQQRVISLQPRQSALP